MITLLRNAELYDPAPCGRRHLVVGGERVLWTGRDVPALDHALGVQELDLGGRRVIPGLIDGHVHLTGGGGEAGPRDPGAAGGAEPAHARRRHDGRRRARHRRHGADHGRAGDGGARAASQQGLSACCHTGGYHVPPTTATGSVRRRHRADRPGARRRRARDQRPPLEPADARRAAPHRGRRARGRAHERQGRHRAPARGRRRARGSSRCAQALERSELPAERLQPHAREPASGALFEEAIALARAGMHRRHHGVSGRRRARTRGARRKRWCATSTRARRRAASR